MQVARILFGVCIVIFDFSGKDFFPYLRCPPVLGIADDHHTGDVVSDFIIKGQRAKASFMGINGNEGRRIILDSGELE